MKNIQSILVVCVYILYPLLSPWYSRGHPGRPRCAIHYREHYDCLIGGTRLINSRFYECNYLLIVAPSNFDRLVSGYRLTSGYRLISGHRLVGEPLLYAENRL